VVEDDVHAALPRSLEDRNHTVAVIDKQAKAAAAGDESGEGTALDAARAAVAEEVETR
jgi:hypothetical protein